jgi:hypothetical protein
LELGQPGWQSRIDARQYPAWFGAITEALDAEFLPKYEEWCEQTPSDTASYRGLSAKFDDQFSFVPNMNVYRTAGLSLGDSMLEHLEHAHALNVFQGRISRMCKLVLRRAPKIPSREARRLITWLDQLMGVLAATEPDDLDDGAVDGGGVRSVSKNLQVAVERALRRTITTLLLPLLTSLLFDCGPSLHSLRARPQLSGSLRDAEYIQYYWNHNQQQHLARLPELQKLANRIVSIDHFSISIATLPHDSRVFLWPLFLVDRACTLVEPVAFLLSEAVGRQTRGPAQPPSDLRQAKVRLCLRAIATASDRSIEEVRHLLSKKLSLVLM